MTRRLEIIEGDCVEVMAAMEAESVDAICTDPPYGLGFMNREWDSPAEHRRLIEREHRRSEERAAAGKSPTKAPFTNSVRPGLPIKGAKEGRVFQEWTRLWAVEALRVLKPGGWAAVFGGTRTYHRMICGLEDAGFEIRDCVAWLYGSGFPKSLDISKAIDKAAGVKPIGREEPSGGITGGHNTGATGKGWNDIKNRLIMPDAQTEAAKEWEGWGTALKPAWEPICLARKPLEGTVAENVLKFGTGGLNIGACRIGLEEGEVLEMTRPPRNPNTDPKAPPTNRGDEPFQYRNSLGRWPANLVLDEETGELLDEMSGESISRPSPGHKTETDCPTGNFLGGTKFPFGSAHKDSGGASRFFYCAKTSRWEREAGLSGLPEQRPAEVYGDGMSSVTRLDPALHTPEGVAKRASHRVRNHHPTVKPVSLMRWIARLTAPMGQAAGTDSLQPKASSLILDPFAGSGTTGMACAIEGFDFIGCEKESEYVEIARRRIEYARTHPRAFDVGTVHAKPEKMIAGQGELFGGGD